MVSGQLPFPAEVPPPSAALAEHAGPRTQVLDDPLFQLPPHFRWRATFRLQLFTAPGVRPVAVATQVPEGGEGISLTNAAERCAAAVWQRHFPEDSEPPIWIAHLILSGGRDLEMVTFTADPDEHTLSDPQWLQISSADVDALVGQPVDLERGDDFVAAQPEPEPEPVYVAMPVILLPRPSPFREDGCMAAGVPWWRRLGRQLFPRRGGLTCCWYHGGDWRIVSQLAIRLVEQARAQGVTFEDTAGYVLDHPDVQSLTDWEREALFSLLVDTIRPYAWWPRREGYNNGQHRAQALIDAGVRRILVERLPD